jgi:DinB superfamily
MGNAIMDKLGIRMQWTDAAIISIGEAITETQLSQQPGPTSPPIGWHLWHTSRWADRFQASFQIKSLTDAYQGSLRTEYWKKENMEQEWNLNKENLGLLETGATMTVEAAVTVSRVKKGKLINYARRVFKAAEEAISTIDDGMLTQSRYSILPKLENMTDEQPVFTGDRQTILFDDFLFHLSHIGRHLGMMEALQGTLFGVSGSASI